MHPKRRSIRKRDRSLRRVELQAHSRAVEASADPGFGGLAHALDRGRDPAGRSRGGLSLTLRSCGNSVPGGGAGDLEQPDGAFGIDALRKARLCVARRGLGGSPVGGYRQGPVRGPQIGAELIFASVVFRDGSPRAQPTYFVDPLTRWSTFLPYAGHAGSAYLRSGSRDRSQPGNTEMNRFAGHSKVNNKSRKYRGPRVCNVCQWR